MRLGFTLEKVASGSRARATRFRTLSNEVLTPIFMPVGTLATVRAQRFETLEEIGSQILLANTYHLLLRPGPEVFRKFGGIHRFMNWKRSVLTDSGGFQVFSLPHSRKMTEDGASFRSYVDGQTILLSPEKSIETQRAIGSDIMMAMDQCIPSTSEHAAAREAMELTHRWAWRSLAARGDSMQSMFGIVQGACYEDLRRESADAICSMPFDGFAIGGLAVGETKTEREDFTELCAGLLPADRPRYLMGVGTPIDLLEAVHRGVDMFDCIIPTAFAQQGVAFTSRGKIDLKRGIYKFSEDALDPACECTACTNYSRAYLHHLAKTREMLGWQLIGHHNLHFYQQLMREIRASIFQDRFLELYREKREFLARADEENPPNIPRKIRNRETPTTLGAYEVVKGEQYFQIKHRESGEVMHSVNDPMVEARALYIEQSDLASRAREVGPPLAIWDVGLGAATNAMAAIRELEAQASLARPVRIYSFENDLDSLKLALMYPRGFSHLRHSAPHALLANRVWKSKTLDLEWHLLEGDFMQTLDTAPKADVIFYDPFSYKTDSPLWSLPVFKRVFSGAKEGAELFTYSASTGVRVGLLAAGFSVGQGVGSGPKEETTFAFKGASARLQAKSLTRAWLERWERSSAKFPAGLPETEHAEFSGFIRGHRQFENAGA